MSTFTVVHHTAPHIPFKYYQDWNAAQAQLNGTVHCDYPKWYYFSSRYIAYDPQYMVLNEFHLMLLGLNGKLTNCYIPATFFYQG